MYSLPQSYNQTSKCKRCISSNAYEYQGYTDIRGSRDAFRKAFEMGIITDKRWMNSIEDRNLTSHNYDDETAEEILELIIKVYFPLFLEFEKTMLSISGIEPTLF